MKTSTSSLKPRLICQLVRTCRSVNSGAGNGHVAGCAECQAFERATAELDSELRREAMALRRAGPLPSPGLARSIQQAVRLEKAAANPVRTRANFPFWLSSTVATAAAVALAVYVQRPANSLDKLATADDALAVAEAVGNLSVKITDEVIPATGEMVANNPLQRELGSVYSDARAALNFLALNFLPTSADSEVPASRI